MTKQERDRNGAIVVDVTDLASPLAWLMFRPFMVHPTDEERREVWASLITSRLAVMLAEDGEPPRLDPETIQRLITAAQLGVGSDFDLALNAGYMAGDLLLYALSMTAHGVKDGGLDKAAFLVSENSRLGSEETGGKRWGRDAVRKVWAKYRTVAHLWAAEIITAPGSSDAAPRDGHQFAMVADCLWHGGVATQLPRGAGSVLPIDALRIVGAPAGHLAVPELSPAALEALNRWETRDRGS